MNVPMAVLPSQIKGIWHDVYPLLKTACEHNGGRYNALDYLDELLKSEKQLWLVKNGDKIRAIVVTQIVLFPQKKCCSIDICTGEGIAEWGDMVRVIEEWATTQGCQQMFNEARPGMCRLLGKHGYTMTHCLFEKQL